MKVKKLENYAAAANENANGDTTFTYKANDGQGFKWNSKRRHCK